MSGLVKANGTPTEPLQLFLAANPVTSPQTYTAVANTGDFTGPGMSAAVVDVSAHGDPWRRKISTLKDPGTVAFPCWFVTTEPSLAGNPNALADLFLTQDLRSWQLAFADDTTGLITESLCFFNAFVSKFSLKGPVAGVLSADTELTIDGDIVFGFA